jgi:hypothetical protein
LDAVDDDDDAAGVVALDAVDDDVDADDDDDDDGGGGGEDGCILPFLIYCKLSAAAASTSDDGALDNSSRRISYSMRLSILSCEGVRDAANPSRLDKLLLTVGLLPCCGCGCDWLPDDETLSSLG